MFIQTEIQRQNISCASYTVHVRRLLACVPLLASWLTDCMLGSASSTKTLPLLHAYLRTLDIFFNFIFNFKYFHNSVLSELQSK